jgi:hypothetical protein
MPQPIYCDWTVEDGTKHASYADVMVTNLNNGDTDAYCNEHYLAFMQTVVEQVAAAAAGGPAAAVPAPGADLVESEAEAAATAADVERRLADPTPSGTSSDVGAVPAALPGTAPVGPLDGPGAPGTQEVAAAPTPETVGAPGSF